MRGNCDKCRINRLSIATLFAQGEREIDSHGDDSDKGDEGAEGDETRCTGVFINHEVAPFCALIDSRSHCKRNVMSCKG